MLLGAICILTRYHKRKWVCFMIKICQCKYFKFFENLNFHKKPSVFDLTKILTVSNKCDQQYKCKHSKTSFLKLKQKVKG